MTKHKILVLDEIIEEAAGDKGGGQLFGSTNLFRDGVGRFNFLFHYLSGEPGPTNLPEELTIVPVSPHAIDKTDQSKMWMYELNKAMRLEQFAMRERGSLNFYEINPVTVGTEIIPVTQYSIIDYQTLRATCPDPSQIERDIMRLKLLADNYAA